MTVPADPRRREVPGHGRPSSTFAPNSSTAVTRARTSPTTATGNFCFVWEQVFGATDHDVYAQMHNAAGALVAGSTTTIDFDQLQAHPKVANNNIGNDFLCAAESARASGTRQIWGVVRDAATRRKAPSSRSTATSRVTRQPGRRRRSGSHGSDLLLVVWQRNFAAATGRPRSYRQPRAR